MSFFTEHTDMLNTLGWLAITGINLYIAHLSFRTNKAIKLTQENVTKIEVATNSMKDALVASTAKASYAEGHNAAASDAAAALITAKAVENAAKN